MNLMFITYKLAERRIRTVASLSWAWLQIRWNRPTLLISAHNVHLKPVGNRTPVPLRHLVGHSPYQFPWPWTVRFPRTPDARRIFSKWKMERPYLQYHELWPVPVSLGNCRSSMFASLSRASRRHSKLARASGLEPPSLSAADYGRSIWSWTRIATILIIAFYHLTIDRQSAAATISPRPNKEQ